MAIKWIKIVSICKPIRQFWDGSSSNFCVVMANPMNPNPVNNEGNNEVKNILCRMNSQLEDMRQSIVHLSSLLERQETKQDELETSLNGQGKEIKKLASETDMHYNIILGFVHGSHSVEGQPSVSSASKLLEEETVKQTALGVMEQPY